MGWMPQPLRYSDLAPHPCEMWLRNSEMWAAEQRDVGCGTARCGCGTARSRSNMVSPVSPVLAFVTLIMNSALPLGS